MATVTIVDEEIASMGRLRPAGQPLNAVSWQAIFAGATASAALSLILLVLGMGLGLSALSPWTGISGTTTAITASTIVWLCLTAAAASGLGGYIAGRLRTRWPDAQRDEVYFRDTAHGFLSWAVATLLTAAVLTSVIGAILGTSDVVSATGAAGDAARVVTDEARRNAAQASLWIFVSLLIGAFSASLLATWGGRQRDLP